MYIKPCVKDIVRIGGEQGRAGFLRLDMNESPGGLPAEFTAVVTAELTPEYLAMYPEEDRLKGLLADYLSSESGCPVTAGNLCLTNGSDMAIRYLYEVFAEPGRRVVTVAPSFEMYRIYSQIFGLRHCPVMYHDDYTLPVEELLAAIDDDTDIIVLLNPNNPVGRALTGAEFDRIADRAAAVGALIIVDEAYHYFYPQTFMKQALIRDHVVVIRTFSKLLSIAGCRLGFMTACPAIIEYVGHVRPSFEVNAVAVKFAEKLLEQPQLIQSMQAEAQQGKDRLVRELLKQGYPVMAQEGNFVFLQPKNLPADQLSAKLRERRILVKTYAAPLLKDWIRVSTGAEQYMNAFLDVLYEVDCR